MRYIAIFFICFSISLQAADNDGKFSAKGSARKTCDQFLKSVNEKNSDFLVYGGWLEGYITSFNQLQTNNYDIAPWQTTELLLILLKRQCEATSDVKFFDAVNSLLKALYPIRLAEEDTIVKIDVGESSSFYYKEILLRAKQRLKELGYYNSDVTGEKYTKIDIKAFTNYQTKYGLEPTGIPDQRTLVSLFLKERVKK